MMTLAPAASAALSGLPSGQGWRQAGELGLALLLSASIGVEREIRQKTAGLRTYTLVGLGAALFVLISKYGFSDVLRTGQVVLDPSRLAAQIVSGVGFLGAGLIFVRRDAVRGLTTAAAIWITAAIVGEEVVISIADEGPGIAAGEEEHIFEKYYRSPAAGASKPGRGLGLSVSRGLLNAMGGSIRVRSMPGGGAIFLLTVPVAKEYENWPTNRR